MKLPVIHGIIRRRILVNYRMAPEVIQPFLPAMFRPKLQAGFAIAGICLIRLEQIRMKGLPALVGMSSENAAHRVAVVWNGEDGVPREGVYIPRRDSDSLSNQFAGGRIFPGEHHAAVFKVCDNGEKIDFDMTSKDGEVEVRLRGKTAEHLPTSSVFENEKLASNFFKDGALGYSATATGDRLEGMRLKIKSWQTQPLQIESVYSSFFADQTKFPTGSVQFDCALLMRNIEHEWISEQDLKI